MRRKKFYIATSIAYTNLRPHLGFALELVQADTIARYHRLLGRDTFFLTGTDEHGQKVAKAARKNGQTPKRFVEEISNKFKKLKKLLALSNDDFIRTTDKKRHWPAVRKVWLKLKKNGDIYKKKYRGFYCSGCEAFITKKDLDGGKCIVHHIKPEIVEEENYFFRLSKYSKKIRKIIERNKIRIIPQSRKNEMLNFVKQGLEDVSFSRPRKDLKWAIPVPSDPTASIYVWADALTNYISALSYAKNSKKFKRYWPADVHCIGKDIQKFHCLIWPGMLLSLKLPLPKTIFVHGFITVSSQKMSKSLGNVVDPFELVKKYGRDPVRYFLLREIPPTEDGDFTYEKFEARYNSDLAKGLGNLVARVVTMAKKSKIKNRASIYGSGGEEENEVLFAHQKSKLQIKDQKFKNEVKKTWENWKQSLDNFKFNEALIVIWELISFCDRYIEKEKPWELKNQKSKIKNQKVINDLLITLSNIAGMLKPFLPETSEKIFSQLKTKRSKILFPRL